MGTGARGVPMRKMVVELYGPELVERVESTVALGRLRAFEVLHLLRYDRNEFAGICRITPKDPRARPEDCFRGDPVPTRVQLLRREEDSSIVLLKRSPRGRRAGLPGPILFGEEMTKPGAGYLLGPPRYRDGKLTFTFAGSPGQLRDVLDRARARGLRHRVLSMKESEFAVSLLDHLTKKQAAVLRAAYQLGYYDVPRRITSEQLGRGLGLRAATVVEHLRKSEKRVLDAILQP